jgi:hypothetical protein
VIAAGAIWVGATRLIDNVLCAPPGAPKAAGPPVSGGFGEAGRGA